MADATSTPSYAQLSIKGGAQWIWLYSTSDSRAVQRAGDNSRLAACWYSSTSFNVDVNFSGTTAHKLTLYCLDWDNGPRVQTVEVIDYDTGRVLDSRTLSGFSGGVYLSYQLQGRVIVRGTRLQSYNAVVSGIFFDPAN